MTEPTASPVVGSERERFRPPRLTGGATSLLLALGGRDRGNWGGPRTRLWPIGARPPTSAARGGARARCQGLRGARGRSGRVIGPPAVTRARPDLATAAPPGDRRAPRGPRRAPRRAAVLSGRRAAPGPCSLPGEKNPGIDLPSPCTFFFQRCQNHELVCSSRKSNCIRFRTLDRCREMS